MVFFSGGNAESQSKLDGGFGTTFQKAMLNLPSDFDYSAPKQGAKMARYAGDGKDTVEDYRSIDVLEWHRLGHLRSPGWFLWAWARDGERVASINVQAKRNAVTLKYRCHSHGQNWSDVEQPVAIAWTPCRFGGERPWFICSVTANGVYCGRSVIKLYSAGRLFACRHCYQLAYASQQQPAHLRGLRKSQKVRMRLGGSGNMFEEFPDKPKGMHWPTYERWRRVHDLAEKQSLMSFGDRLGRLRAQLKSNRPTQVKN